jgi:hypothetical protein
MTFTSSLSRHTGRDIETRIAILVSRVRFGVFEFSWRSAVTEQDIQRYIEELQMLLMTENKSIRKTLSLGGKYVSMTLQSCSVSTCATSEIASRFANESSLSAM